MSTSDDIHNTTATGKCPFHQGGHDQSAGAGTTTRDWWPNQLRVDLLNHILIVLTRWVRTLTTAKNSAN